MSEQPVSPQPQEADDGWRKVADTMHEWHPGLQEHAKRHLAMRGLLPPTSEESESLELHAPEEVVTPELVGDPEKLKKGIKIVVGGPPHSGKSVFIEALSKNLDKGDTFAFSACPDGEGPWLQRHYDDPEVVKWRQKGQFRPEFVDRAKRVVDEWEGPLMLVDIGGRTSEENAQIVEGATHAIVLAGDLSKVNEWKDFFKSRGVEVMAVLHSHYHGNSDQIVDKDGREANPELRLGRLTASVHHLERGEPAEDRLTIKEVAASIHELVASNTPYQEAHEAGEADPTARVTYELGTQTLEALDLPDLPKGYGYIGGAARAIALRTLYGESAPIRDIDIVAFEDFHPDMSHQQSLSEEYMPDDYAHGYGVHGENLDTYFSSRDLTVNEVAVVDGKLILTKQAEADLREKIIRPTAHEKEAYYGSVGPKMTVKMLLLEQVFQQEYGKGEAVEIDPSSVEPFYIALGLNKAMQYGEPIAQAFVKRLDQLEMLDRDLSIDPKELAAELRDITDFIFRGFELAERINRGETISPTNDLLDGDSEFDNLYDRYSRFDVVKNRARANGKGKFRSTDEI